MLKTNFQAKKGSEAIIALSVLESKRAIIKWLQEQQAEAIVKLNW